MFGIIVCVLLKSSISNIRYLKTCTRVLTVMLTFGQFSSHYLLLKS